MGSGLSSRRLGLLLSSRSSRRSAAAGVRAAAITRKLPAVIVAAVEV